MISEKPKVLLVEDDPETLSDYLRNLQSEEYELVGARSLAEALASLEQNVFDAVVTDLELFNQADGGMQIIERAKALDATIATIMVTVHSNTDTAKRAIRELGASAFFPKPLDFTACRRRIHEAIQGRRYQLAAIETAGQDTFVPIRTNPYVAGKPLSPGSTTFYGRDEIFHFIQNNVDTLSSQNHVALVGPRRIGKTSILMQLPTRLGPRAVPIYIDCQSFGIDPGMPAFFLHLNRQIRRSLQLQNIDVSDLPILTESDLGSTPALVFSDIFLPQLWRLLDQRHLILCLDEFEELKFKVQRGRLEPVVFVFLRQLLQTEEKIVCILAGSRHLDEIGSFSREAASIVNMVNYYRVGVLSPRLARRLIEEPVAFSGMHYEASAVDYILEATGGHPFIIQLLCGLLVNRRNELRQNIVRLDDVKAAIPTLVEKPQLGFFWESLTPFQQAVLICAGRLWERQESILVEDVEAKLREMGAGYKNWEMSISQLLHQLSLEELLTEHITSDGQHVAYKQTMALLNLWVRRHKALDQIQLDVGLE